MRSNRNWQPVMKTATAILTNRGGRTCHAAIVARELDVPAVVGTGDATSKLQTGATLTVSCAEGDVGRVYEGTIPFEARAIDLSDLPKPKTEVMVNLGDPDLA
jgi:pyruvate,water dikinase